MKKLIQRVQHETPTSFNYQWLGEFVKSIDASALDYKSNLPELPSEPTYSRNIFCFEPFEVVLLHWPVGVESAVHLHRGFWGYVLCLDGQIDNIIYHEQDGKLVDGVTSRATSGGIINEPDGTIHKIVNSGDMPLVTLHFYAPALETLDGLVLYDLETGTKGTLNDQANAASFTEPDAHFKKIEKGAFTYGPTQTASHRLFPLLPKPNSDTIRRLIGLYYEEQAQGYDSFDLQHPHRKAYTSAVNGFIADGLKQSPTTSLVLDMACGTGRRAIDVRERSGLDYKLHGLDLSPEMAEIAHNRGIATQVGPLAHAQLGSDRFDAVTFLYAYGHIPTEAERRAALLKIKDCLRPGGQLFFDVFNAECPDEWGPRAVNYYEQNNLDAQGYESGDVFYRKDGGQQVAFLHYCTKDHLTALLTECGFEVKHVLRVGYSRNAGQLVDTGGALFFHAIKP